MTYLNLKPTHQPIRDYYSGLKQIGQLSLLHEGAVAPHFANLLRVCAGRMGWTLAEQHPIPRLYSPSQNLRRFRKVKRSLSTT